VAQHSYWPPFESRFLDEVAGSLRKRSKALRHKCSSYGCEKVWEIQEGLRREKAEISFKLLGARPVRLSCHLWDDRWTWIDVRQPTKAGWRFEWRHEGRIGSTEPLAVSKAMEQTLFIDYANIDRTRTELDNLWSKIAVTGPRGTV
jgi:hypothetical protein